jgi:putative transposase
MMALTTVWRVPDAHAKNVSLSAEANTHAGNGPVPVCGAKRWVFNWALRHKREYYAEFGETLATARLEAELVTLKLEPETAWLAEIDSQLLQQALRDLDRAFENFFARRTRFPRFKRRKDATPSFRIPQRVRVEDGMLSVPKLGPIRMRYHRPLVGTPKSATIKRDACGAWFVTLVVEVERAVPQPPPLDPATTVGIDMGLREFAIFSTGQRIPAPRCYRTAARRLKRAQRSLARKQRGSANRWEPGTRN